MIATVGRRLKPGPCSCHGKLGQHGETWNRGMTECKSPLVTDVLSVLSSSVTFNKLSVNGQKHKMLSEMVTKRWGEGVTHTPAGNAIIGH